MRYFILLFSLLLFADEQKLSVEQLFSVQTLKVKKVSSSITQKNYGYVKADESKRYSVTPRFGGYIEVLYADSIYMYVKKGSVLAQVYSPEVLSAKEEYLASLKFSMTHRDEEMVQNSRKKLLLLGVNPEEIEYIKQNLKVSNSTNIYAPRSGYIFKKSISNLDAFSAKQKLFEIVNMDSVWVEVKLHQKELENLANLEKFFLHVLGMKEVFDAKKGILYPSQEKNEATFTLRLHVQNKKHMLQDGMYVRIEASGKKEEYLTLPTTAVMRKNGTFYVFVAGEYEGEYTPQMVDVKVLDASTYIIKSGVDEGAEVVNNALFMMDSDAQINGLY